MYFHNRCEAGRRLARGLLQYQAEGPVVLALPRGGVPVAYEVAHLLEAPLDVLVASKIGAPGRPELAVGAVASSAAYYDEESIQLLGVSRRFLSEESDRLRRHNEAARERFQLDPAEPDLRDKTAIIVDDGIATGATAIAAVQSARHLGAAKVVVSAPVCAPEAKRRLEAHADAVVCLEAPADFGAVGFWYEDFSQVSDQDVRLLLKRARLEREAHYHR